MAETDWTTWLTGVGSVIAALTLWFSYWSGRTAVSTCVGSVHEGGFLKVTNHSAHAITIEGIGIIEGDGSLQDWWGKENSNLTLPHKIEPRSSVVFKVDDDYQMFTAYQRFTYDRIGCYVVIAGGKMFANVGRLRRIAWKVRSVVTVYPAAALTQAMHLR